MAISEETKDGLQKFVSILSIGLGMLPYTGCSTAATVMETFITPEMIANAAEAVGIREIVVLKGGDESTFTGTIDQRTKP